MATFKPNDIAAIASDWTSDELREAIALLSSMLEESSEPANDAIGGDGTAATTTEKRTRSDGYIETKPIKGKLYQYRRYRQDGRLKSEYIGPV